MTNKKLIRFLESFVLLPIITMSGVPMDQSNAGPIAESTPSVMQSSLSSQAGLLEKFSIASGVFVRDGGKDEEIKLEEEIKAKKAEAINAYFRKYDMPLVGTGRKMVEEAEKNGIDWRLLPAIAVRESTGGKHACKGVTYSAFGWGSCKINFDSNEEAIETVARNLGGNNPNTDHHYAGKTTKEILQKYNPPSIVRNYANQVMNIMDAIGEAELEVTESNLTT